VNDPAGLGWDRELDSVLYDMYARKLPWRGWAGHKSPAEREYIDRIKARRRNSRGNRNCGSVYEWSGPLNRSDKEGGES
jgi:hypothetical protein